MMKSITYEAPHYAILNPSVTFSLLGPHMLPNTLFSHTLNLCSYLSGRDKVAPP